MDLQDFNEACRNLGLQQIETVSELSEQASLEADLMEFNSEAGQIALETDNGDIAKVCCRAVSASTGRPHIITPGINRKFAVREMVTTIAQRSPLRAV